MGVTAQGNTVLALGPGGVETHVFATEAEAAARTAFVNEALSWVGTPFQDCAAVKGPNGCVDCAMLLLRSAVDTGLVAPFDPRPYPPRWHLHRDEERFVDWVVRLGGAEVKTPRVGDIILWRFGRTFSHGAVLINSAEVMHAFAPWRMAIVTPIDEPVLSHISAGGGHAIPRPRRCFDIWSGR